MNKLFFTLFSSCIPFLAFAANPVNLPPHEPEHLVIHNRILAQVNGKTISVIDVMKKMDVFLSRAYPQYMHSKLARYQFYSTQWRNTLAQMIDNELILADAVAIELKVNDGDVRETLQERFGPNVMASLEKIGITYEEAREMIYSEIVVQRMQWFKVNSKALLSVHPQDVKAAYKEYCQQHPPAEDWKYQVLSIRGKDSAQVQMLAKKIEQLTLAAHASLQEIYHQISHEENQDPSISITLPPLYEVSDKSLSAGHREVLASLKPGSMRQALCQPSRDGSTVFRLFHLQEHTKKEVPPFEKLSDKLFEELVEKAAEKESSQYLAKLRQRFSYEEKHFQASLPEGFEPFSLK